MEEKTDFLMTFDDATHCIFMPAVGTRMNENKKKIM
jgi:hypothetical protein